MNRKHEAQVTRKSIGYAPVGILVLMVVLSGCTTITNLFDSGPTEEEQIYIVDELHRIIFENGRMGGSPEQFSQNVYSMQEEIVAALTEFEERPNDMHNNREIFDWFGRINTATQAAHIFQSSIIQLYQENGGRNNVLAIEPYPAGEDYFVSEEDMIAFYCDRHALVCESLDTIGVVQGSVAVAREAIGQHSFDFEFNAIFDQVQRQHGKSLNRAEIASLQSASLFNNYSANHLYHLSGFEQLQTADTGLLISLSFEGHLFTFFLETTQRTPDGFRFDTSHYAFIDGIYEYSSLSGRRTVYRLVHVVPDQQPLFM